MAKLELTAALTAAGVLVELLTLITFRLKIWIGCSEPWGFLSKTCPTVWRNAQLTKRMSDPHPRAFSSNKLGGRRRLAIAPTLTPKHQSKQLEASQ